MTADDFNGKIFTVQNLVAVIAVIAAVFASYVTMERSMSSEHAQLRERLAGIEGRMNAHERDDDLSRQEIADMQKRLRLLEQDVARHNGDGRTRIPEVFRPAQ